MRNLQQRYFLLVNQLKKCSISLATLALQNSGTLSNSNSFRYLGISLAINGLIIESMLLIDSFSTLVCFIFCSESEFYSSISYSS